MRLLLDNDLSPQLVRPLRDTGHDTEHVRDHGLQAAGDATASRYGTEPPGGDETDRGDGTSDPGDAHSRQTERCASSAGCACGVRAVGLWIPARRGWCGPAWVGGGPGQLVL